MQDQGQVGRRRYHKHVLVAHRVDAGEATGAGLVHNVLSSCCCCRGLYLGIVANISSYYHSDQKVISIFSLENFIVEIMHIIHFYCITFNYSISRSLIQWQFFRHNVYVQRKKILPVNFATFAPLHVYSNLHGY